MSLRGEVTGVKIGNLTEEGLDPADHLFGAEGFGDVTHGADLSSSQNVGGKSSCCEHDDRQMLGFRVAAQPGREIETICGCCEGHVQQDQIYFSLGKQSLRRFGGWCLEGGEALPAKFKRQDAPNIRLIVDNQNAAPHVRKSKPFLSSDQD